MRLSVTNHDRDAAGMTYVYPVVSRRAAGVSVGVNLNPDNACNWRCIYCQVPDLRRGGGPEIDTALLRRELRGLLDEIVHGDFMQRRVPPEARRLNDVALSGNGEPTSSPQFVEAVTIIGEVLDEMGLAGTVTPILITNGSLVHRAGVVAGLSRLARLGGEVWFKLDSATDEGMRRINDVPADPRRHLRRLRLSAELCPTWIQTCVFATAGAPPSELELAAYVALLGDLVAGGELLAEGETGVQGVLLYSLSRPSLRPGGDALTPVSVDWMEALARRIEGLGLRVRLSP